MQKELNLCIWFQELLKDNVKTFANENKRLQHKLLQMEAYSSHSAAAGSASASMSQTSVGKLVINSFMLGNLHFFFKLNYVILLSYDTTDQHLCSCMTASLTFHLFPQLINSIKHEYSYSINLNPHLIRHKI